jgi:hypothetical protein
MQFLVSTLEKQKRLGGIYKEGKHLTREIRKVKAAMEMEQLKKDTDIGAGRIPDKANMKFRDRYIALNGKAVDLLRHAPARVRNRVWAEHARETDEKFTFDELLDLL